MNSLHEILMDLFAGSLELAYKNMLALNDMTVSLIDKEELSQDDRDAIVNILLISNIIWENTDRNILPLDSGVYDLLREKAKNSGIVVPVGAPPVKFTVSPFQVSNEEEIKDYISPIKFLDNLYNDEDLLYLDTFLYPKHLTKNHGLERPVLFGENISKRLRNTAHEYPDLVGTLDKCKFVMNYQAKDKGVFNDANVTILERDFFGKHIIDGILDPNRQISVLGMIKFDGVSAEGDMISKVFTSRGDAIGGVASDITPILRYYNFPNEPHLPQNEQLGVQFEAIMTYNNLERFNQLKGYNYKNCRTAISGLFSSSDAYKYVDLITLVPLASSLDLPKDLELEFLNKYYSSGINNSYEIFRGNYQQVLYQIKKFAEEAEMMRDYLDFMYDGIVITYLDQDIIEKLGRANAVNNYSVAVKFNPLKRSTFVIGCNFTVGKNGMITPMVHYRPVEFMGTIHPKSSIHSLARFFELGLRENDIIDLEYVNDVMPYVYKPENSHNLSNTNPIIEFPTNCPVCGTLLVTSKTEKSAFCPNITCHGRKIARVVDMVQQLGIQGFSDESMIKLDSIGLYTFRNFMECSEEQLSSVFGPKTTENLIIQRDNLKNNTIKDYEIIGSLGFDNMAKLTWKKIFNKIRLQDLVSMPESELEVALVSIHGIGRVKATTVIEQLPFFIEDIVYILNNLNVVSTTGTSSKGLVIRMTGFRDKELIDSLSEFHDISDGSITRNTNILLVPTEGYDSGNKMATAKRYIEQGCNIKIIPVNVFKGNLEQYLNA